MDYRYDSHTVFKIEYHFVWVTKYRYPLLKSDVGERVREIEHFNLVTKSDQLKLVVSFIVAFT